MSAALKSNVMDKLCQNVLDLLKQQWQIKNLLNGVIQKLKGHMLLVAHVAQKQKKITTKIRQKLAQKCHLPLLPLT